MHPGCRPGRDGCSGGSRSRTKTPVRACGGGDSARLFACAHGRRIGHPPLAHRSLPSLFGGGSRASPGAPCSRYRCVGRLVQGLVLDSCEVRPGAGGIRTTMPCCRSSAPESGESSLLAAVQPPAVGPEDVSRPLPSAPPFVIVIRSMALRRRDRRCRAGRVRDRPGGRLPAPQGAARSWFRPRAHSRRSPDLRHKRRPVAGSRCLARAFSPVPGTEYASMNPHEGAPPTRSRNG